MGLNPDHKHAEFVRYVCADPISSTPKDPSNPVGSKVIRRPKPLIEIGLSKFSRNASLTSLESFQSIDSLLPQERRLLSKYRTNDYLQRPPTWESVVDAFDKKLPANKRSMEGTEISMKVNRKIVKRRSTITACDPTPQENNNSVSTLPRKSKILQTPYQKSQSFDEMIEDVKNFLFVNKTNGEETDRTTGND